MALVTVLLGMSVARVARAEEGAAERTRGDRKHRFFADPPLALRAAPELLIAANLQGIPLQAYGLNAAIGPRLDASAFYFTPALTLDLLWGDTENGLDFSSTAVSLECEFTPYGSLDWLRLGLALGGAENHVERVTSASSLEETVWNAHFLLSADVLRVHPWFALWVGGGVRFLGDISAPVVLVGGRI